MPKTRPPYLTVPVLLAAVLLGMGVSAKAARPLLPSTFFDRVQALVSARYIEPLSRDSLVVMSARALVKELGDPYSTLLSPSDMASLNRSLGGGYAGLGVQIESAGAGEDAAARIVRVFPSSPAAGAGLARGDLITHVEGETTHGWDLNHVSDRLLGVAGTSVSVTIRRPGLDSSMVVRIVRAVVHSPTVPYFVVLPDSTGYIPVTGFSETSAQDLSEAVRSVVSRGARRLVIDLRSNPGGRLEESIEMSDMFLKPTTPIASVETREGVAEQYTAKSPPLTNLPLALLVNSSTASAAEIMTGALQDNDRALVVGGRTFGKGVVQSIFRLEGGYALKLTTGRWRTPLGRSLHRSPSDTTDTASKPQFKTPQGRTVLGGGGITPDITVTGDTTTSAERAAMGRTATEYATFRSVVLSYAASGKVPAPYTVTPAMTADVRRALLAKKVLSSSADTTLDRVIPRILSLYAAQARGGDEAGFLVSYHYDTQLRAAISALKKGKLPKAPEKRD